MAKLEELKFLWLMAKKPEEKEAITQLIRTIESEEDPEKIQSAIFEAANRNEIKPKDFFKTLYMVLFGTSSGPRLGPYLVDMGTENAVRTLHKSLRAS